MRTGKSLLDLLTGKALLDAMFGLSNVGKRKLNMNFDPGNIQRRFECRSNQSKRRKMERRTGRRIA